MGVEMFSPDARPSNTMREGDQSSMASLFTRLLNDATALLHNEFALARAELTRAADNAKTAAIASGVAVAVLLAGALAIVAAVILALAEVMAPWAAALLVGVALAITGIVLLGTARKKLAHSSVGMERTQNSLKQDAALVARKLP
jgi:uncharacterized membrane protein YqjE